MPACGTAGVPNALTLNTLLPTGFTLSAGAATGASCYHTLTAPAANAFYVVTLESTTLNQDLLIFNSGFAAAATCSSSQPGTTPDSCSAISDASKLIYVTVTATGGTSQYRLTVQAPSERASRAGCSLRESAKMFKIKCGVFFFFVLLHNTFIWSQPGRHGNSEKIKIVIFNFNNVNKSVQYAYLEKRFLRLYSRASGKSGHLRWMSVLMIHSSFLGTGWSNRQCSMYRRQFKLQRYPALI